MSNAATEAAGAGLSVRDARHVAHELVMELESYIPAAAKGDALEILGLMHRLVEIEWPPGLKTGERFLTAGGPA